MGQVGHVTGSHGEFHYESLKIQEKDKQKLKILSCGLASEVEALGAWVVQALGNIGGGIDLMNIGKKHWLHLWDN